MTPKDKSKDLINSFYYSLPNNGSETGLNSTTIRYKEAIQCALICVDEVINQYYEHTDNVNQHNFWQDVKDELNKKD